ncbi:ISXo5 transposase, partial [mine drainage metagenome]
TLVSGTVFEATKLPLTIWFLAIHLLTSTKTTNGSSQGTNMAALELKRHLGVSYRTAWRLKHKVMEAMTQREEPRQLNAFVQVDDAYLGGERNGGKPGRGSENKQAFVIAIETDAHLDHPTFAVIEPVRTFDNDAITAWAQRRLAPEAEAFRDSLGAFRRFEATGHAHAVLESEGSRAATEIDGARWVNVLLSNLTRSIGGACHAFKQHKQICTPLSGRSRLPLQPPFSPTRVRAATVARHGALFAFT